MTSIGKTAMKIGIISDTHDQLRRTQSAVALLKEKGAAILIHCGDLTRGDIVEACSELPLYFVFGNGDFENASFLRQAGTACGATCLEWGGELEAAGRRIAVTHGHMPKQVESLLEATPDLLLTGHSHQRMDCVEGSTRRINPGALHRAREFTVVLFDTEKDELQFLPVVN